jgi:hypothetical protein
MKELFDLPNLFLFLGLALVTFGVYLLAGLGQATITLGILLLLIATSLDFISVKRDQD